MSRLFSYLSGRLTSRVFADNSKLSDLTDISKIKDVFTTDYNANTISDLQDANKVKAILEATPEVYKELLAQIINHIMYRDIPNAVVLFMEQMAGIKINESIPKHKLKKQYGVEIEVFNEETKKQMVKQALLDSFITSAVYEMFDIAQSALISKEAVDTVIDISENIHNYPEVFKIFEEYLDELMRNHNLGKISSDAFVNQFKNKIFMHNISHLTSQKVKELARAWTRKENTTKSRKIAEQAEQIKQENNKTNQYEQKSEDLGLQNAENIQQARYSNGQIKNIVELTKMQNNGRINTQSLLDAIQQTKPEILPEDLKRFKLDKEIFYRR